MARTQGPATEKPHRARELDYSKARGRAHPTSPAGGADINAQLAQAHEVEAKLAEEYRAVRLLRASITGEASARYERTRELGKQARERINTDFDVDNPSTPPQASQKLIAVATLLRAMAAPLTPEARNLHREAQALIEQAAVQQAESSASCIRQQGSAWDEGGAQGPEASVHTGGATGQPANQGRTPVREQILDTRGQAKDSDACNVNNVRRTGNVEARAAAGYNPRRGGRYDSREDCSPMLGTSNNYVASTLRKDFQVLFIYATNTPVGCTNVNPVELIKSKGDLTFPRKPSHPRGLLRGASPPQKKWSHFFTKTCRKCTKYASTEVLGELTWDASG
jgi:hypothetical protein